MPRPVRLTRDAIVASAREVVAAEGLGALSLRPLARRLGVTAPALYAHFESKEALVAAVAQEEFATLLERMQDAAHVGAPPVETIKAQSRAYVEYAIEHPSLAQVMFVFAPAWAPDAGAAELPIATKAFEVGAVAVTEAIAAGELDGDDPLMVSLTIWSAVHGVATLLSARPALGHDYEQALVDSVIDSVVAGLAPRDTRRRGD